MRIDYPREGRTGPRRFLPSWRQWLALGAVGFVVLVMGALVAYVRTDIPTPNDLATAQATIVTYDDGSTPIGQVAQANRRNVSLDDVPLHVQQAVLSAEDRTFYDNNGFSPAGIARAAWTNVRSDQTVGGSTITQQYAKNAYLSQEKTFTRKAKELILSVKLSQSRSKDRILEDYLNTIYFGRGAYGIEAAAEAYFRKPASDLTVAEGAVLAAIIRSPGGYAPETNQERLEGRFAYVLDGMVLKGWLSERERVDAEFPAVRAKTTGDRLGGDRGYLIDMVKREMAALGYTEDDIARGGFRVVTTFNKEAQEQLRSAVADAGPKSGTKGLNIGAAAVRPDTGEVVAIYGGDDFVDRPFNNATQGIQQAGSTFKPFALAAGLEEGFTLRSRFAGRNNTEFEFPGFEPYKVPNFDNASYGSSVSLLRATEDSINTAYVDLSREITPRKVVEAAERAGLPEDTPGLNAGPTTVLGTASPRTIDMAAAYATFANQGLRNDPFVVRSIIGSNGAERYRAPAKAERVFSEEVANEVTYALSRVVTNGSGTAALRLGRPAAGKTGTTNENRSAWFVGYTPDISVAVSMSKSDSSGNPISLRGTGGLSRVTGGSFPARIWTAFVRDYMAGTEVRNFPDRAGEAFTERRRTGGSDAGSAPRTTATVAPPTPTATSAPAPTKTAPGQATKTPKPTEPAPTTAPPGGGGGSQGGGKPNP